MMMKQSKYYGHFHSLLLLPSSCFIIIMSAINTFFAILTLKITDQSNRTKEFGPVLTCKHDRRHYRRLQILWSIALKLQIGKDDNKKESKYQKYIYYASNGFMANQVKTPIQNYFEKVLYENLTFEIPPLCFFKSSRGIKQIVTSPCGSLFVLSSFFFWPLFCLSFDLRLLLIPFVSPYSSYT